MIDVAPVRIVTEESGAAVGPSLGAVLPWVMMGLGAALMAGVAVHSLWRWYARLDDAERAFLWMSLRLRLGRRERGAVRALARGIDAAPVALLVSESAFRRSVEATERDEAAAPVAWRRWIGRVDARVFGGPAVAADRY